jgi:hypothetical protein
LCFNGGDGGGTGMTPILSSKIFKGYLCIVLVGKVEYAGEVILYLKYERAI